MRIFAGQMVMVLLALSFAHSYAHAADSVSEVTGERVVVIYHGVPVSLSLANIELPKDPELRQKAEQRIQELVEGTNVQLVYKPGFGVDELGSGHVFLRADKVFVNVALVEVGMAKYVPGEKEEPTYDKLLAHAQKKAKRNKAGLWALEAEVDGGKEKGGAAGAVKTSDPQVASAAKPSRSSSSSKSTRSATKAGDAEGAFGAELSGRYYYPKGHKALRSINPQRLIWYSSEADAKKAGKRPAPGGTDDLPAGNNEKEADEIFDKGAAIYAQAVNMPATKARDVKYGEAFNILTKAVQSYAKLIEKDENNDKLQSKLRRAMQLRYGAMKMRRA